MNTEQLDELIADIETALGKGHRGYTIRGTQMNLVVQALRAVIEMRTNTATAETSLKKLESAFMRGDLKHI
jgi:hypothetical protein